MLCSQLTWRTDCYARWIQFELLAGGEAVRAPASSAGNLESDNLFFAQKCGLKSLVAHLHRLRCATLWDGGTGRCCIPWCKVCGPEALPLASPLVHSLFASNFLLKHIAVLHFDGMITNHKEIGLGHLLPSWFQDDVFTLPNWQAWALATPTSFLRCCRSCYLVAWLILKRLLGLAGWAALFEKRVFLTLNSALQSTYLTDRLLREMDPIWTACWRRSSQSIGQFYGKPGKW